jgi:hypothetical protein
MLPRRCASFSRSGYAADVAHLGRSGGLLFALFMLGWGCSLAFSWMADRVGRTPALMLSIAIYSLIGAGCPKSRRRSRAANAGQGPPSTTNGAHAGA